MTVPRYEIVKPNEVGVYHCISRCVRRAFLCGLDRYLGKSFEHRREWVRKRLGFLVEVFAMDLVAYAIMSNHLHTLLRNRPDIVLLWPDEEVAIRWRRLFPLRHVRGKPAEPNHTEILAITSIPELVAQYRERLSSISWFNRCLNEQIAKMANVEDECKGRFWEGRFKSQRVEDLGAILTCSCYIDLNPIRAGIAKTPEESNYTSIQDRIIGEADRVTSRQRPASPRLLTIEEISSGDLSTKEYLTLVDTTGRMLVEGKGSIPEGIEPILTRLKVNQSKWLDTTRNYKSMFRCVVGPSVNLCRAAQEMGKAWLHGIRPARAVFG